MRLDRGKVSILLKWNRWKSKLKLKDNLNYRKKISKKRASYSKRRSLRQLQTTGQEGSFVNVIVNRGVWVVKVLLRGSRSLNKLLCQLKRFLRIQDVSNGCWNTISVLWLKSLMKQHSWPKKKQICLRIPLNKKCLS